MSLYQTVPTYLAYPFDTLVYYYFHCTQFERPPQNATRDSEYAFIKIMGDVRLCLSLGGTLFPGYDMKEQSPMGYSVLAVLWLREPSVQSHCNCTALSVYSASISIDCLIISECQSLRMSSLSVTPRV